MRIKPFFLTLALILLPLLNACRDNQPAQIIDQGSGASSEASIGATDVPATAETPPDPTAPLPRETPAPSPTPQPTATPDPAAGFVPFESEMGGFRFRHPPEWTTAELAGLVLVASSAELLEEPEGDDQGGVLVVTSGPTADMAEEFRSSDPLAILNEGFQDLAFGENITLVDGPHAATIDGREAATALVSLTADGGRQMSAYLAVIVGDPNTVVAFGAAPQEEDQPYLDTFAAIASTMELFPPLVEELPAGAAASLLEEEAQGMLLNGDRVQGKLTAGQREVWQFVGLEDEQFDILLTPLAEGLDLQMDVVDAAGNSILAQQTVQEILGKLTVLGLPIDTPGLYYILIDGLAEEDAGGYELYFYDAESGPPQTATVDDQLAYGQIFRGSIESEGDTLFLPFSGRAGDIAMVLVDVDLDLDVWVDIQDSEGSSLVPEGNDNSEIYEVVAARLPADGTYQVAVSAIFGSGEFEVVLNGPAGSQISGSAILDAAGDEQAFPFTAQENDLVYMMVQPQEEFSFDLALYDEETDEALYGLDFSDRAFGEEIPEDGDYYFQVNTLDVDDDGQADGGGPYEFTILGPDSVQFELAAGDRVQGKLDAQNGFIDYLYVGTEGETIALTLELLGDGHGIIEVRDFEGNVLASSADSSGAEQSVTYTFQENGLVTVQVSQFSAESAQFELTLLTE